MKATKFHKRTQQISKSFCTTNFISMSSKYSILPLFFFTFLWNKKVNDLFLLFRSEKLNPKSLPIKKIGKFKFFIHVFFLFAVFPTRNVCTVYTYLFCAFHYFDRSVYIRWRKITFFYIYYTIAGRFLLFIFPQTRRVKREVEQYCNRLKFWKRLKSFFYAF